jgi:hypothetical protein
MRRALSSAKRRIPVRAEEAQWLRNVTNHQASVVQKATIDAELVSEEDTRALCHSPSPILAYMENNYRSRR